MIWDDVAKLVNYDPRTGEVTWKKRELLDFKTDGYGKHWNRRFAGKPAGSEVIKYHPGGWDEKYVSMRITINNRRYSLSKLIWLKMTGSFPVGNVHHRNADRRDLRWLNLYTEDSADNKRVTFM